MDETGEGANFSAEQNISQEPVHSFFYDVAVEKARQKTPEKVAALEKLFGSIDRQTLDNMTQFSAEGDPETLFPMTTVDVNSLYDEFTGHAETPSGEEEPEKQTYVIFGPLVPPPDGHPMTGQDVVYDRAIGLLSRIAKARNNGEVTPQIRLHVLGYPHSTWGKVSEKWMTSVKQDGFDAYGKAYTEYVRRFVLPDKPNRLIFQGMSFGGSVSISVLKQLSEAERANVKLLLDNPAGLHKKGSRWQSIEKGLQIPEGFAVEFMIQKGLEKLIGLPIPDRASFYERAIPYLAKRGVSAFDDRPNKIAKAKATWQAILTLVEGARFDIPEDTRTFIRQGIIDPTTTSWQRIYDVARKMRAPLMPILDRGARVSEFPMKSLHGGYYTRVEKWGRVVDLVSNAETGGKAPNYTSIEKLVE